MIKRNNMKTGINEIYLRRKTKVLLNFPDHTLVENNVFMILTMMKNLESLGFIFSVNLLNALTELTNEQLEQFYNETVPVLKEMVGAHKQYSPMYPNFPKQVMKASDAELYANAMMHYLGDWVGLRILPAYEKKVRKPLDTSSVTYKVIDIGTTAEFKQIFTDLLSSKTSISEIDKADVEWFVKVYREDIFGKKDQIKSLIPSEIPMKENVALLASLLLKYTSSPEKISRYVKTATDVLRIAVGMSEGDVSLATACKFRNFKRSERRFLLQLVESLEAFVDNIAEDMYRWRERWKRLAGKLHPHEHASMFPKACEAIDYAVSSEYKFATLNSKVEFALSKGQVRVAVGLLSNRAGDLARRLNILLEKSTTNTTAQAVLDAFENIADKISTPVLLQVMTYFKNRRSVPDLRVFFPKGTVAKIFAKENDLLKMPAWICNSVIGICRNTLIARFKELPSLGNVYLDETLKNYTVPFAQRSASKALKTISRGSKIQLPEGNTVRFFMWWKDMRKGTGGYYGLERVDLDLSAMALDSNFNYVTDISYYNLREQGLGCHSGDITSAPKGACEFVDINIKKALQNGYRYIVMCVNSFTSQPYKDLPEAFAGVMIRNKSGKGGEIFDARTVENKFDLTADSRVAIPMIIDLETREVTWADLSFKQRPVANNVWNNRSKLSLLAEAMVTMKKPNLYDLFELHALARGKEIIKSSDEKWEFDSDPEELATVFSVFEVKSGIQSLENTVITPFDMDKIMAEYL